MGLLNLFKGKKKDTDKKEFLHKTDKRHIGLSFRLGDLCGTDAHIDVASIRKTNVLVRSGS